MKKLLLTTLLAFSATLAYAGSGCCAAGGEKDKTKDASKDAGKSGFTEASTVVAGNSCGGGSCGDKETKSKLDTTDSLLAGSGCGGGSCGDKGKEKSGFTLSMASIA